MNDLPPAPAPAETGGASSRERLAVYLVAAVPTLVKLLWYPAYPGSDDAFIHLTMVRNLTHSLGWGINPGEPVYLSSSPLFTLLLAGLNLCGFDPLRTGEWLSAASSFFALVFLHRLLVRLGLRPVTCLAGVVVAAFNVHLWRWNGVVMETMTSLFLLTLAYWSYHGTKGWSERDQPQGRYYLWFNSGGKSAARTTLELPLDERDPVPAWRYLLVGVAVGLAALTRFELTLAIGCFGLCEMANRPRTRWLPPCLWMSAGFLLVLMPWLIFCHQYFHAILPTTFYHKTTAHIILWNPKVASGFGKVLLSSEASPLLGFLVLAVFVWRNRQSAGWARIVLPRLDVFLFPLLLALFYYTKTEDPESSGRYFLPGVQILVVALACVFDGLSRDVPVARLRPVLMGVLAAHAVLALAINQWAVAPILQRFQTNYLTVAREAARYLKERSVGHRPRVLVEVDIGMLSYFTENACYWLDGGALATPWLNHLTVPQQVAAAKPDLVVEALGSQVGGMATWVPGLHLVWHREFLSHSLTHSSNHYFTNIYEHPMP